MPSSPPHLSFLTPWMFKSGFLEKRTNPGHLLSFISLFQAVVEYVKRDPDKEHSGGVCVYNKGCMRKRKRSENIQIESTLWSLCALIVCLISTEGIFRTVSWFFPGFLPFWGWAFSLLLSKAHWMDGMGGQASEDRAGAWSRAATPAASALGFSTAFRAAAWRTIYYEWEF